MLSLFINIVLGNFMLWQMPACRRQVHTKEIRSKNMAAIKVKNTKPEMLVRRFLHANGFRYKLHDKSLLGKPDINKVNQN